VEKKIREEGLNGVVDIKMKRDGSWKKCILSVSLDKLCIHRTDKLSKLVHTLPLTEINEIDIFNTYEHVNAPSAFGFGLSLASYRQPYIWVCSTESYAQIWRDEITWRRQAVSRIQQTDEILTGKRKVYSI